MPYTSKDVDNDISALNQVRIPKVPKAAAGDKTIKIFNVSDRTWTVSMGSFGTFYIPPCPEGAEYSRPVVIKDPTYELIRDDFDRSHLQAWDARDIAKDVLGTGENKGDSEDKTKWGVFMSDGDEPTADELASAKAIYQQRLIDLVAEADTSWNQGPNHYSDITEVHRKACTRLNLDRPWNKAIKAMAVCPMCGDSVNASAAVHAGIGGCGAVLDEPKVIAARLKGYEHLWAPKPPGEQLKKA